MNATFSGSNIFTVANDRTAEFVTGRRVKANCVADGYVYASVVSSSYIDPNTVVVIDETGLTSNLITVLYGVVEPGAVGSLPDHAHDESEGSGGEITSVSYPKYYIESDVNITVGSYGQYVVHETGYLEVAGSIELKEGAMIIIEQGG